MCASEVLPSPGGPGEQHVVERLAAALGGLDEDRELRGDLLLVDEVAQGRRAQRAVEVLVDRHLRRSHQGAGIGYGRALVPASGGGGDRVQPRGPDAIGIDARVLAHAAFPVPALRRAEEISSCGSSPCRPSSSCSASSGA